MSSHELEIIEFFIEPIKGSALGAYYGVTEIDCKTYWNRCCINGKFLKTAGFALDVFRLEKSSVNLMMKILTGK